MQKSVMAAGMMAVLVAVAGVAVMEEGGLPGFAPAGEAEGARDLARGADLYQANCAACHGVEREGAENWRERGPDGKLPAPPLDGTGHTWHHPDEELIAIITHGIAPFAPEGYKTDMEGFGDELSDAEIRDILAYIKAQWPEEIRERQPRRDR